MNRNQMYNAMFHRMSIRKYSPDPLPSTSLDTLAENIQRIPSLTPKGQAKLTLLAPTQVSRALTAPHYLAAYSKEDSQSLMEAGYRLQYTSLLLFTQEIGSCYNGIAAPHPNHRHKDGMDSRMIMALGTPLEPSRRTGPSAFKRRSLTDIASSDVPLFLSEAVRVAPSAMNTQPWYLGGNRKTVEVYRSRKGLMDRILGDMTYIDLGIALCHLRIAAEKQGFSCAFQFTVPSIGAASQKRELVCTVALS